MLTILDYGAGNVTSMALAFARLGVPARVVRTADEAADAGRVVFPGVGSAAACMKEIRARGFDRTIVNAHDRGTPTLAVCIGLQLLFDSSEEDGGVSALGFWPGQARRFTFPAVPGQMAPKVPHMGWNRVHRIASHPVWPDNSSGSEEEAYYFVHSYHVVPGWFAGGGVMSAETQIRDVTPAPRVYGATEYGGQVFASAAGAGSFFAVQFHPERSGAAGLALLARFAAWDGRLPCS